MAFLSGVLVQPSPDRRSHPEQLDPQWRVN
jgi:hypothetical protein